MTAPRKRPTEDAPTEPMPGHRLDHSRLLVAAPDAPPGGRLDAILVPTARPAVYLRDVLTLARELGVPVVALCSRRANARAASLEARLADASMIAVDVPEVMPTFPCFETDRWLGVNPRFRRTTDTSLKRNVGLALSVMAGWRHVVYIDDDIAGLRPADVLGAAALLRRYDMAALANVGFPDNSVVCHALRAVGEKQRSFVGGGAMAVSVSQSSQFFPNIYNEDWLFMVDSGHLRRTAVTGRVSQKVFDPYDDPERARGQEFGDCLGEGIFALLEDDRPDLMTKEAFWEAFLADRGRLIEKILALIPTLSRSDGDRARMIAALRAADGRRRHISAEMCVSFVRAWEEDILGWHKFLEQLPAVDTPRHALRHLKLFPVETVGSGPSLDAPSYLPVDLLASDAPVSPAGTMEGEFAPAAT